MANSATKKTPLSLQNAGSFYGYQVIPILINYDTPGNDLTIDQATGKIIYLSGWEMVSGIAANVTLKSGITIINTMQFASNSGQGEPYCPTNPAIICNTEASEALVINANQALPPFHMYVFEV